jgi:hypothetical protein
MWGHRTRCAGALGAIALLAGACTGASAARESTVSTGAPPRTIASTSTTSSTAAATPHRTATRKRPARWNGDGTPPPALHNTGDDYVAIFQSLERSRRWLEGHHPDPALIPRVWVPGTTIAAKFQRHLGELWRAHCLWVDVGDRSVATVVSVLDGTVSLRVDEYTSEVRLVDATGRVVDSAKQGPVLRFVVLLSRDGTGHWKIASVEKRLTNDVQVDL